MKTKGFIAFSATALQYFVEKTQPSTLLIKFSHQQHQKYTDYAPNKRTQWYTRQRFTNPKMSDPSPPPRHLLIRSPPRHIMHTMEYHPSTNMFLWKFQLGLYAVICCSGNFCSTLRVCLHEALVVRLHLPH